MRKPESWEGKWKKFLYEGTTDFSISFSDAENLFGVFHLSDELLAEPSFTFIPRTPRYPARDHEYNVIEDDFTPRVSVATTIDDALDALEVPGRGLYVYAANFRTSPTTNVVDLDDADCPSTPEMPYDKDFNMRKWLAYELEQGNAPEEMEDEIRISGAGVSTKTLTPSSLPKELGREFENCVPDAEDNDERWLLKPTEMLYLGQIADSDTIKLSSAAVAFLKDNAPDFLEAT